MAKGIIHVGDRVDISLTNQMTQKGKEGSSSKVYKSQVNDIRGNGRVELIMPMEGGKFVLLPLGVRYQFTFYTSASVYRCTGQIKERFKKDNINLLLVEFHSRMEKSQRREFYRFPCMMDTGFFVIPQEDAIGKAPEEILASLRDEQFLEKQKMCRILDLSGGGARALTTEDIPGDSYILLALKLTNEMMNKQFLLIGHVLSTSVVDEMSRIKKYQLRIQFLFKDNKVREEIIKFIFEEERRNRSRG